MRNEWLERQSISPEPTRRFRARLASGPLDVRAAQRLRYHVFGEEMGVTLRGANLRLGAYVCGNPAWDPEFRTANLFLLLPIRRVSGRYVERLCRSF